MPCGTSGIGATTLNRVQEYASSRECSFYDALRAVDLIPNIGRGQAKLESFVAMIEHFKNDVQDMSVSELMEEVNKETGYIDALITLFRYLLHVCLALLLVLALVDLALQKYFFAKRMRMTYVEVVKEYKGLEGDPYIKMMRRALAQELAQEEHAVKLPPLEEADMLLVNPTHFAVALYYRPPQTPLPILVAKGADAPARRMIERAKAADVPVIQCVWLTRTLYQAKLGQCIGRDTLQAVALVYRTLRELDDEARSETLVLPELERR